MLINIFKKSKIFFKKYPQKIKNENKKNSCKNKNFKKKKCQNPLKKNLK